MRESSYFPKIPYALEYENVSAMLLIDVALWQKRRPILLPCE